MTKTKKKALPRTAAVALQRGELVQESVEGRPLIFRRRDGFGNLTELCRSLNQRPSYYLRLPRAKELIVNVNKHQDKRCNSLSIQSTRGSKGVTWVHPYLLIDCAMHFDGYFGISCYNALLRLVAQGAVASPDGETASAPLALTPVAEPTPLPESRHLATALDLLADQVEINKTQRAELLALQNTQRLELASTTRRANVHQDVLKQMARKLADIELQLALGAGPSTLPALPAPAPTPSGWDPNALPSAEAMNDTLRHHLATLSARMPAVTPKARYREAWLFLYCHLYQRYPETRAVLEAPRQPGDNASKIVRLERAGFLPVLYRLSGELANP